MFVFANRNNKLRRRLGYRLLNVTQALRLVINLAKLATLE